MELNARYYWILELANHLCLNHTTYAVNHFVCYANFLQKTQRIQVGNRQYVSVLFIILIIIDIRGHRFEIYTLVSKMHENIDIFLGNVFELEGVINSQECSFIFLNRPIPLLPKGETILKPK